MRGRKLHGVWPDHAGTGTRRLRRPLAGVGAGRARDSGDPFIRLAQSNMRGGCPAWCPASVWVALL